MSGNSRAVEQYLERHAESLVREALPEMGRHEACLVVPACDERVGFIEGLRPALHVRSLLVVVVNAREDAPAAVLQANAELLVALPWVVGSADVLVIDRTSEGRRFPPTEGVGLARKLGLDLGVALRAAGRLTSPWIHTSDADVVLPHDYFRRTPGSGAALHYPYWHVPGGDTEVDLATAHYEVWLRYWTAGLRWAGSRHAHPSIGSCMAVHAEAYAAVRGVPRHKQAGEDFHLLNKLRKQGPVAMTPGAPVRIRARASNRVPFGTGPGVRTRMEQLARGDTPRLPHPTCFEAWRWYLRAVDRALERDDPTVEADLGPAIAPDVAGRIVASCNIVGRVARARAGGGGLAGARRRVGEVLDGLAAVRFIHAVRDHGFEDGPWTRMLEMAPFVEARGRPGPLLHRVRMALSLADGTQLA